MPSKGFYMRKNWNHKIKNASSEMNKYFSNKLIIYESELNSSVIRTAIICYKFRVSFINTDDEKDKTKTEQADPLMKNTLNSPRKSMRNIFINNLLSSYSMYTAWLNSVFP